MRRGEYILARLILGLIALIGRVVVDLLTLIVTVAIWLVAAVIRILLRPVRRELANAVGRTRAP